MPIERNGREIIPRYNKAAAIPAGPTLIATLRDQWCVPLELSISTLTLAHILRRAGYSDTLDGAYDIAQDMIERVLPEVVVHLDPTKRSTMSDDEYTVLFSRLNAEVLDEDDEEDML